MRFLVLWFPDWPVQALPDQAECVAVARAGEVWVCSHGARKAGVRRGMRVRHAQALCPRLEVVAEDQRRDAEAFEQVVAALDDFAAGVEVLRPGLVAVDARAAAKYHGSEDHAVELLVDAAALRGVDSCAGVADEITTAIIAARTPALVPAGASRGFLRQQPLGILAAEEALAADKGTVQTLSELGLRTLGDVADIGPRDMVARFGAAGEHIYRLSVGQTQRRIAPSLPGVYLPVHYRPEEPMVRVDAAAFAGRQLAHELHTKLEYYGVACQRLCIRAEFGDGESLERIWRTRETLSESGMADRVRWQLDGWLAGGASKSEEGGIVALTLDPLEVSAPDTAGLWGDARPEERIKRVIERVQATLGPDRVLQPVLAGGRGVARRVQFAPYGEPVTHAPQWNGALPGPHPARLMDGEVALVDAAGATVEIDEESLLSAVPAVLQVRGKRHEVTAWAGPWPEGTRARLQVVAGGNAYLVCWVAGGWRAEASYA